jgi:hypothetical protein
MDGNKRRSHRIERVLPPGLDALGMPMPTHPAIFGPGKLRGRLKLVGKIGDLPGLLCHRLWCVMGGVQQRGQYNFGNC